MTEQITKSKKWYQDSILIKLGVITILILLLLIPSSWIQDLITEREGYQQERINSVSDKWSGSQLIQGPVLMLPYKKEVTETAAGKPVSRQETGILYVLPESLQYKAGIQTEMFKKGVYDVVVYNSKIAVKGNFDNVAGNSLGIDAAAIQFDKARLVFGLSDLKGLKNNPVVKIQNKDYSPEPAVDESQPFAKALQVSFPCQKDGSISFNYDLDIKGSNELNFLHIGKTTEVEVNSDWARPDFNGRNLPDSRTINAKGFTAKWHMLYYNRPFPQQWVNDNKVLQSKKALTEAVFGVKLQVPVDQYKKVMRTAKYSTLIILLTFISLFLAELIRKDNVHVFNYTLVGAAMVVYYILLLSFSEQIGYNYAYLLSSASTIALISIFTASLLKNRAVAALFALILTIFYGFIFIIIQLEELSLLFGSIGLFIIVATLMYFSRKINWDRQ